jgi:hypothetical protein
MERKDALHLVNENEKIIVPKSDDTISIETSKDGEIILEKTLADIVVYGNPYRDGWGYPIKIRRTPSRSKRSG